MGGPADLALGQAAGRDRTGGSGWAGNRVTNAGAGGEISKIKLPPGYTMEWDGEYKSARDIQASSVPGMVAAALLMALILVGLFNSYRKPLIIFLIIPFAMIGVTAQ